MLAAVMVATTVSPALATAVAPTPAPKAAEPAAAKQMTRAQLISNTENQFKAIDTNHDGQLDANEITVMQQKQLQQGRTAEQQKMEAEFTKLDTNHDGQLSKAEFMAAAPQLKSRVTPQQFIGAMDANKDGKISLQELEARPLAAFNKLDANHDGTVTAAELQAARQPKK
jgi:Ca2+-binding EF-hand superfamily protein